MSNHNANETAFAEFYAECDEVIQRVTSHLQRLEQGQITQDLVDSLYRDIHTLKGSSQLFGFQNIGLVAHAMEASLEPIRRHLIIPNSSFIDFLFKGLDLLERILKKPERDLKNDPLLKQEILDIIPKLIASAAKNFAGDLSLPMESQPIKEKLESLKNTDSGKKTSPPKIDTPPLSPVDQTILAKEPPKTGDTKITQTNAAPPSKSKSETDDSSANAETSTIRIQVSLLDKLMNLMGEMVLVRNQVLQFSEKKDDFELHNLTQGLDLVTTELQENIMKTRMQPIGSILTKFQRVVRDLSRDLGKQIELSIKGADTELDKSLIEAIKDPLTHIIRNACDHGLETIAERKKTTKPEVGQILIQAFHEGGHIVIDIADDGRGLNTQKIVSKAIEKKIITPEQAAKMSERDSAMLIFAPGFSTADQVSAVSGRGVGMDVVKTNIEKVGGLVELTSHLGKGTTIRLRIPLTLAIVPVMTIQSSGQLFAIPQVKFQELVRIDQKDEGGLKIEMLQGQPVLRLRGQLLPIIDLAQTLKLNTTEHRDVFNIVILSNEGQPFGLVTDEIRDTADIVVKPLPQFLKKINAFSGSTIMGDGRVSLILDIVGIAEIAHVAAKTKKMKGQDNSDQSKKQVLADSQEMLFFELNAPGLYCIPLVLVHRLEEFSSEKIERSGRERMVKYRDSILPILSISEILGYSSPKVESEITSVIVVSKRRRQFGLEVSSIVDIASTSHEIIDPIKESPAVMGTLIFEDQVVTVIDVLDLIERVLGPEKGAELKTSPTKYKFKKPYKILYAEDTPFFFRQVKKLLEEYGLEITHCPDGAAAMKTLEDSATGTFDLILSDIEMPNMNGFQFAAAIRQNSRWKDTPLVALTTRFREVDIEQGKQVGFNRYLEKLKSDQLLETLTDLLGAS